MREDKGIVGYHLGELLSELASPIFSHYISILSKADKMYKEIKIYVFNKKENVHSYYRSVNLKEKLIKMKKTLKAIPLFALVTLVGFGCASGNDADQTKLTFYSTVTSEADQNTMDNEIDKFEEENPDIEIDQNYPTS